MQGRNYRNMYQGYYYDQGKAVGYDVDIGRLLFVNVAYYSKGQLIDQLVRDGYNRDEIKVTRIEN